jgi:hypothetical protein
MKATNKEHSTWRKSWATIPQEDINAGISWYSRMGVVLKKNEWPCSKKENIIAKSD